MCSVAAIAVATRLKNRKENRYAIKPQPELQVRETMVFRISQSKLQSTESRIVLVAFSTNQIAVNAHDQ